MAVVTMRQLLESGVHFGHQTRRWNPKMKRFIFTERNGIYIIDLQQSLAYIDAGYEFVKNTVARGGTILFVGTKRQAQEPVEEQAKRVGMPFVNQRWLGGMLTNFQTMHQRLQRMKELEEIDFDDVSGSGRTKKELLQMRREYDKLSRTLGGVRDMSRTPAAVWIVDTKKEHLAVDEAKKLNIPIVAILDTNCDPDDVDYPIPGNDDAIRSVSLLTRVVADAVAEGLIARGGSKTGEEEAGSELGSDEPLAEWERELLEKKDAEAASARTPRPRPTPLLPHRPPTPQQPHPLRMPRLPPRLLRLPTPRPPRMPRRPASRRLHLPPRNQTPPPRRSPRRHRPRSPTPLRPRLPPRLISPRSRRRHPRPRRRLPRPRLPPPHRDPMPRSRTARPPRASPSRATPSPASTTRPTAPGTPRPSPRSGSTPSSPPRPPDSPLPARNRPRTDHRHIEVSNPMSITATEVKKLRDATGAGMMDAKKALTETDGDFDKAIEVLRISGAAKAAKRSEREASSGLVANVGTAIVELNSETDFVAKNDQFIALAEQLAELADQTRPADAEEFASATLSDGKTVAEAVADLAIVIGEKIELGRVASFEGNVATYMHRRASDLPPAVGVLVEFDGDNAEVARGVAMQIAAMRPRYLTRDEVPDDVVAKEREIAEATAREEGKPEQAMPKIIEGRLNGFFKDVVLLDQPSVQDNKKTVKSLVDEAGVTITRFAHIEVGV